VTVAGMPGTVSGTGGKITLTLTTGAGCRWTAASDVPGATVTPDAGVGSGAPIVSVDDNPSVRDTRSGNLLIGGQTIRFSQAVGCTYTLDRTSFEAASDAANARIQLTTREGCPWTATASESWVRPVPSSGSGSMLVELQLSANTGDVRHATATIAGQRVAITQAGR
jgi:hypothetical protein